MSPLPPHQSFKTILVLATDESRRSFQLNPVVVDAIAQGLSRERYTQFLLELRHVVWHFNPICALAASRLGDEFREVRYFLYNHIVEEMGHEVWVENDLRAIGTSDEEIRQHRGSAFARTLVGYNYHAADRVHPCSALGMLYALEAIAASYGGPFADSVQERLFLDGDAGVSFVRSHSELDAEHADELSTLLATITDPAAQAAIVESAETNFHHFEQIIARV